MFSKNTFVLDFVPYIFCCFPKCSRNQGVDYTNTELDIKIGRIKNKEIKSINNNYQDSKGIFIQEKDARQYFRKWDNIKHIREILKTRNMPKIAYTPKGLW